MKFLQVPGLASVTAQLRQLDTGDRIINGRAELFSCVHSGDKLDSRKLSDEIDKMSPLFRDSPLGPLAQPSTKSLLINLIMAMNSSFPEYDFSKLTPEHFVPMKDLNVVVSTINYNLAILAERVHRGFLADLWRAFRSCIDLNAAEVYSYVPDLGSGPHAEALWSFDYFFYDKAAKRILFFSCVTTSRQVQDEPRHLQFGSLMHGPGSHEGGSDKRSIGGTSASSNDLMLGEYDFGGMSDGGMSTGSMG